MIKTIVFRKSPTTSFYFGLKKLKPRKKTEIIVFFLKKGNITNLINKNTSEPQ